MPSYLLDFIRSRSVCFAESTMIRSRSVPFAIESVTHKVHHRAGQTLPCYIGAVELSSI
jgi:hypothetical protein